MGILKKVAAQQIALGIAFPPYGLVLAILYGKCIIFVALALTYIIEKING